MPIGTPKKIEFARSWSNTYGEFDQYDVEFEDGTTAETSVKKGNKPKFVEGEPAEYEIKGKSPKGTPKIGYVDQKDGGGHHGGGRSSGGDAHRDRCIFICNAMNNAVALIGSQAIEAAKLEATFRRILSIMEGEAKDSS